MKKGSAALAACLLLLAGCAGGGAPGPPSAGTPVVRSGSTSVTIVIRIPARSAATRHAAYVSPSTQSIAVGIDATPATVQNLAAGSANCSNAVPIVCTLSFVVTPGAHQFTLTTFDAANGAGNVLSTGTVAQTIVANQANTVNVILDGIPTGFSVVAAAGASGISGTLATGFSVRAGSTQTVLANAVDADGNVIIGPGSPAITVTIASPSAGSGFTVSQVAGSANTFAVSSSGFGTASLAISTLTPNGAPLNAAVPLVAATQVATVAGTPGTRGFADGTGTAALFQTPTLPAYDPVDQNLYLADQGNCDVRGVNPSTGAVVTLAGSASTTPVCGKADGSGTNALFAFPSGAAYDLLDGNLYITDTGNCAIRQVMPAGGGVATLVSGTSTCTVSTFSGGSGGNNTSFFASPSAIAYDAVDQTLYMTDAVNCTVLRVTTNGGVAVIAGNTCGFSDGTGTSALFRAPDGIAFDTADGNLYVTDTQNCAIRQVNPVTGSVTTIAGNASPTVTCGFVDAVGTSARFLSPVGITYDAADGNLYVTDTGNCVVRQINPASGAVVTFAGAVTQCGFSDGVGASVRLNHPAGIVYDAADGNLYVTDTANGVVRRVLQ